MNFNSNQRSKVIQGLRSFKDTLPTKIKKIINKKGTIYPEILDNWKHFVGNDLFKFSFPIKYKNSNKINNSTPEIMIKRGKEIDIEYSKNKEGEIYLVLDQTPFYAESGGQIGDVGLIENNKEKIYFIILIKK